jgi:Thioredoxin.
MKQLLLLSIIPLLFTGNSLFSQSFSWVNDEEKEYQVPIGIGDYKELKEGTFYTEMMEYYDSYVVDTLTANQIKDVLNTKFSGKQWHIDIVFGAWCGDSKEHLPCFYKIVQSNHLFDWKDVTLIATDRDKKAGEIKIDDLNIEFVPTFIFYVDGKEIGRIIETPENSLEKDLLNIIIK